MPLSTTAREREQMQAYYAANRERILAQKKARYRTAEGKAAKLAASRKWYTKNRATVAKKKRIRAAEKITKNISESSCNSAESNV